MTKKLAELFSLWLLSFLVVLSEEAFSASLPKATQQMLRELKLDASVLSNLDMELEVPKEWVEKAKSEGRVRMLTAQRVRNKQHLFAPFKERYPFIQIDLSSVTGPERVKTLVAYRAGRILADISTGVEGDLHQYKAFNALESLRDIPSMKGQPDQVKDPEDLSAAVNMSYYCMAYNTRLVKKNDLPKGWEDIVTNPRWREGNLALANRPSRWAIALWKAKGERWITDFLVKLFDEVRPQLRKEALSALLELAAAGEFHAVIPGSATGVHQAALTGGPISLSCPDDIVPMTADRAIILRGSPNKNAAKVFLNWFLSKEGQVNYVASFGSIPIHKDLHRREFGYFPDQWLGKQLSYSSPEHELEIMPKLEAFWNNLWLKAGSRR